MTSKILIFPGISISEKDFDDGTVLFHYDKLIASFQWDTGVAISTYLQALKQGIILGSNCSHCRKVVVPPRIVCESCFKPMQGYIPLQDSGVVNTFSVCYVTWDVKRIKEPELPAVIDIDGASPLCGIMHKLGEVNPDEIYIGMKVKAVWKPAELRTGAITDILYFKPVKEA